MSDRFSHVEKHRNPHNGTRGSAQQHRFYFQINQNPVKGSHPNLYGWLYQIWIHLKKPALTPSAWPIPARNKMISKTKSRYDRVLTYRSKYMLQRMYIHNFEMKQPKAFFNFTKSAFSCKFCPFCFVLILEYWFVYKRNVYSDSHNLYSTVSELIYFVHFFWHYWGCLISKLCVINIYFDLYVKRRSCPLLVLGFFAFWASILFVGAAPFKNHRKTALRLRDAADWLCVSYHSSNYCCRNAKWISAVAKW